MKIMKLQHVFELQLETSKQLKQLAQALTPKPIFLFSHKEFGDDFDPIFWDMLASQGAFTIPFWQCPPLGLSKKVEHHVFFSCFSMVAMFDAENIFHHIPSFIHI